MRSISGVSLDLRKQEYRRSFGDRNALQHLRAIFLLGGSIRPGPLVAASGRLAAALPVDGQRTFLDLWQEELQELQLALDLPSLRARLILDAAAPEPSLPRPVPGIDFVCEREPRALRGTAGLLHDLTSCLEEDDCVLVGTAAQLLLMPLVSLARDLEETGADLSIVAHADGTPSGLLLVRAAALRAIPDVGFVDLKEQALPAIAREHRVSFLECEQSSGVPVRTLNDYLRALKVFHELSGDSVNGARGSCPGESPFSIVEDGAVVTSGATIYDSVVLRGGRVERGALVARSMICRGGVVRKNQMVADQVFGGR
jgi:hypothetical protein